MKKTTLILIALFLLSASINAQTAASATSAAAVQPQTDAKPKRQIFRANKQQISNAQKMLKEKGLYAGAETGKLDDDTRASIKSFQAANALNDTGTLNRATLEKMGILLTDAQKQIPVSQSSYASSDDKKDASDKPKRIIFRANKEQINEAQKLLKTKGMYGGEETGKLDDATREGLKKFQADSKLKVTGTLNQVTLEKMGIALTDKQKENAAMKSQ